MNKLYRYILTVLCSAALFSGCSLEDSRDECCEKLIIEFRYSKGEKCILTEKMSGMRVFLFDENETLVWVKEVEGNDMKRMELIGLPVGNYTVLGVGNFGNPVCLEAVPGQSRLSEMSMNMLSMTDPGDKDDINRIYYGYLNFQVEQSKEMRYICDMSNHHCKLSVTVRWKNGAPSLTGPYDLKLSNISGRYSSLIPATNICVADFETRAAGIGTSSDLRVTHNFIPPCTGTKVNHLKSLNVYNNELFTQFLTIRYREDDMPTIKLTNGSTDVTPAIDLGDFFRRVGWQVDENIEQTYSIILEIDEGGGVVTVWPGKAVSSDWEDGGTIM